MYKPPIFSKSHHIRHFGFYVHKIHIYAIQAILAKSTQKNIP